MSRQLVQIFVHSKSLHRYLELSCPLFKLPFSYPSHPSQLFPLLFFLFFKQPFFLSISPVTTVPSVILSSFLISLFPIHSTRYYCSLFYSVFFLISLFPIHLTRYYCSPCYSVFFLSCLFPIHFTRYYCSFCYSVFFLSSLFSIHFTRYNCSFCYSVFFLSCLSLPHTIIVTVPSVTLSPFYPVSHLPHPTIVTVSFVTLSPLTLSLFHFFVALSHRCFSLLFLVYESIFSSSVDLIFLLYSIPIVYYKTIYLCLYLYIFSRYYLSI